MKRKTVQMLSVCLATAMLISGCGKETSVSDTTTDQSEETVSEEASAENASSDTTVATDAEYFSDRDFEVGYDEEESALILLNGDSAASNSDAVEISGTTVTITDEGTYILTGTLDNGMIIVNSEKTDKTQIVLNGVTIHSETSAPIYILQSDKVFITTAPDTINTLSNGGTFAINSADDAVHSNTSVTVNGGSFDIATGDDAFHAEETLLIADGIIAISESYEGLEGLYVEVTGGEITLTASDDGINAAGGTDASGMGGRDAMRNPGMSSASNGSIIISGGTIQITASGDGLDANGTLEITGGYTVVCGPTQGDTATLDYDVSGTISGGTFIGTGASGMAQSFSDSSQGVVAVSVGNQSAGTTFQLSDSDGNIILTHTPELSYQVVILSSLDIVAGETYTITVGTSSGEITAK